MKCLNCGFDNRDTAIFCNQCGRQLAATANIAQSIQATALPNGALLQERYRIMSAIKQGGMGTIYLAQDTRFSTRTCAVKEMLDTFTSPNERTDAVRRFEQESDILAALHHPNIISVFDRFTEGQRHYLVMPFIKGRSLEEHLTELGGSASIHHHLPD